MKNTTNGKKATISRRAWLAQVGCLGIGLGLPGTSGATQPTGKKNPTTKATPRTHYLISAILREGVQDFIFRLVHSVQPAASVDEATGIFTRLVQEKYTGYSIAQTTVTEITLPPGACLASKPGGPRKPMPTLYIVSAAMRDNGGNNLDTLLVNGWLPGRTADEALSRVIRDVKARYPLFTPASTLVTELGLTLAGCPAPGPASGPVRSLGDRA